MICVSLPCVPAVLPVNFPGMVALMSMLTDPGLPGSQWALANEDPTGDQRGEAAGSGVCSRLPPCRPFPNALFPLSVSRQLTQWQDPPCPDFGKFSLPPSVLTGGGRA